MSTPQHPYVTPPAAVPPPVAVRVQAHGKRVCEWCKEAMHIDAIVCPHCRRERKRAETATDGIKVPSFGIIVAAVLLALIIFGILKKKADEEATKKAWEGIGMNVVEETIEPGVLWFKIS